MNELPEYEVDPRDIFLRGCTVFLKVLTEDDVLKSGWYGWFNDEETTKYMQKHYFPLTREEQLDFWKNNVKGVRNRLQLGIVAALNPTKLLGCVSLNNIDHYNRKAEVATIMGEAEGRNIKFYLEANQLIIKHAFETLNLQRIYGGAINREIADMMCRVIGFKIEGTLRKDIFKNGVYHDTHLIGLLRDEFKFVQKTVHG